MSGKTLAREGPAHLYPSRGVRNGLEGAGLAQRRLVLVGAGQRDQESCRRGNVVLQGPGAAPVCSGVRNSSQDRQLGLGQAKMRERVFLGAPKCGRGQRRQVAQRGASVSPQETSVPEELLVTVVKPGLPTLADLHVLLPPPRLTRKRSPTSDKVSLWPWAPGSLCTAQGSRPSTGGLGEKSQQLIITERPISRKSLPDTGGWPSSMGGRPPPRDPDGLQGHFWGLGRHKGTRGRTAPQEDICHFLSHSGKWLAGAGHCGPG